MSRRICGCKDDNMQNKRLLLKKFKESRVTDDGKTIYVGVVFHICYQNYVKADVELDVKYSIDLLNKDFNKQCSNFNNGAGKYVDLTLKKTYDDYVALADTCNIEFYTVDIKYVSLGAQSSSNISVLDNNIKKASPVIESNKYLNLWIADLSGGLLGYAQFPWEHLPNTDGIVIAKATFGRKPSYAEFALNKTMTHEIGHWFGLYHTFQETFAYDGGIIDYQDGTTAEEIQEVKGDCVADTPPQSEPTYGNPLSTPTTWPSSKPIDETKTYRHMFMNFMDYSDDDALFMFTQDQKIKLRQMIQIYRPDILKNNPNPIPDPIPTIDPIFASATYNFETTSPGGWIGNLQLNGNTLMVTNSQISTTNYHSGTKCLRTRRTGQAELKVNLTGVKNVILTFFAIAANTNTCVWVRPVDSANWYSAKLETNNTYKQYTFNLPGPFDSIGNNHYILRFGTNNSSSVYSYFDDITVTNIAATAKMNIEKSKKAKDKSDDKNKKNKSIINKKTTKSTTSKKNKTLSSIKKTASTIINKKNKPIVDVDTDNKDVTNTTFIPQKDILVQDSNDTTLINNIRDKVIV